MKEKRQSNFELLRIFAILAVITGHFIRQSVLIQSPIEGNDLINTFLGSGARIAVNIFLLIGSWFMVDATFNPQKIIKLYLQVAFYCVPITLIMAFTGNAGENRNIVQGLLPFFGRPVWFASAYISLMILTPFLNMIFQMPKKKQTYLALILFTLFCIVSTIPSFSLLDYIADFSWFCVVYVIIGWIKKNDILSLIHINKYILLTLAFLLYVGLCVISKIPTLNFLGNYWLDNIKTLPNFACAFFIFLFFVRSNIGTCPLINFFARSIFAVYIVHQIPAFRAFEWGRLCFAGNIASFSPPFYTMSIIGMAMIILIVVTLIDFVRIKLFDFAETKLEKRISHEDSLCMR